MKDAVKGFYVKILVNRRCAECVQLLCGHVRGQAAQGWREATLNELAIHIHIPFCRGGCVHCDAVHCGQNIGYLHRYRRALERELAAAAEEMAQYDIASVHIHGDAFRLLGPGGLDDMLRSFRRLIPAGEDTQWVADVMPDEIDDELLHVLRTRNRMDRLQLQLFSDNGGELRALHAPFTANIAVHTLERLAKSPLEGLDAVLVLGIPGQTAQSLQETVSHLLAARPGQVTAVRFHNNRLTAAQQREYAEETDWAALIAALSVPLEAAGYVREGKSLVFARQGCLRRACTQAARGWPVMGFGMGAFTAMGSLSYRNTDNYALYAEHSDELERIAILD